MAKSKTEKEPLLIVRPAVKRWGIDYLHVSLIVLVVILILLALALATFRPGPVYTNCVNGIVNGSCMQPAHNSSQVLAAAESIIASYANGNSSLELLPYYSDVNYAQVSYLANKSEWLVVVPFSPPNSGNKTFSYALLMRDSNLSLVLPYTQSLLPIGTTNNKVVSQGVVQISGRTACTTTKPIPLYLIVDPYAPGAINSFYVALNASKDYAGEINLSDKVVFTGYADSKYAGYGVNETQINGAYLWCASNQPGREPAFLANYSNLYDGNPISAVNLNQIAIGSGMNMTQFNNCLQNAPNALEGQAKLTQFYNITTTPTFVINCKYATIPQTLNTALNYALNQTKG